MKANGFSLNGRIFSSVILVLTLVAVYGGILGWNLFVDWQSRRAEQPTETSRQRSE